MAAGWVVNPSRYAFTMTAIASVEGGEAGMLVGAFVGRQRCRGVEPLRRYAGMSRPLAFLTAYSNAASGESVSFRLYDPSSEQVRLLTPAQPFVGRGGARHARHAALAAPGNGDGDGCSGASAGLRR